MHYLYNMFHINYELVEISNAPNRWPQAGSFLPRTFLVHPMISPGLGRPTYPNDSNLSALLCKKMQHTQYTYIFNLFMLIEVVQFSIKASGTTNKL